MKIVLGPIVAKRSRIDLSKPMMSDVMPTMAVMPMTIPRTVNPERILFVRTVSNAMAMTSLSRSTRMAMAPARLLPSQGFDRIQSGCPRCRVQTEEEPDERGDADAERAGPHLDGCWK